MEQQNPTPNSGMTVNERLSVAGLINHFDAAVKKRDSAKVINILSKIGIEEEEEAEEIAQSAIRRSRMWQKVLWGVVAIGAALLSLWLK